MSVEIPLALGQRAYDYLTEAGDPRSWGERPGSVPAVHRAVIVYRWLEAGVYHEQAYGPIDISEDDFNSLPTAMVKVERRWKLNHSPGGQVINVSAYLLEPL